jgi:hypothetical protein
VHRPISSRLLIAASIALFSTSAFGQYARDAAAQKKMDEAINQHYLATEFDKAEQMLVGTVRACEDKCSPQVVGKLWMYVGIVRGSGKQDLPGAQDAFAQAIAADPKVELDMALATDEARAAYEAAGGGKAAAAPTSPTPQEAPPKAPSGGMQCTPIERQVQTRRRIPVSCQTSAPATKAEIRYQEFGAADWKSVPMQRKGQALQGEVPCSATKVAGALRMFVVAQDQAGDLVDNFGTKADPVTFEVAENVTTEPPAFPGMAAPERCPEEEECPPGLPGCPSAAKCGDKDWGASCDSSVECKCGLLCMGGTCETAPSCDTNADCEVGVCFEGKCSIIEGAAAARGPFKRHWVGLHVAQDLAFIGGSDVCVGSVQKNESFACFYAGTEDPYNTVYDPAGQERNYRRGEPFPGAGIATGAALATTRALLSYDFALTPNIAVGTRLGFAFNGGPPAGTTKFLPIHAEARGTYYFLGLDRTGFRPYVALSGGLAQVDAKVQIKVYECAYFLQPGDDPEAGTASNEYWDCVGGNEDLRQRLIAERDRRLAAGEDTDAVAPTLDVYKKMGQGFASAGGGVVYAFTDRLGVQLNVNAMLMLPSIGFVIEPSLGMQYGF